MPSSAATRRILLASASIWTWSRPCAWMEILSSCSDIVDEGPPRRSPSCLRHRRCFSLLHQRPLLVDHLLGVRSAEFLDVGAFWLREPIAQPEDLRHGVCLLLYGLVGRLKSLKNGDDHESE